MILGGWKKPLSGFLIINLIIFAGFYFSELPFSYLYEDSLRKYYLLAIERESILYFLIFLLFPDKDLRMFRLKGESLIYFISLIFLTLELFFLDFSFSEYNENPNKGTTLFELGTLLFILSTWRNKFFSQQFLIGFFLVILITVISGKRMSLSFIFMRILYNSSINISFIKFYLLVSLSFLLLTISSFFREGILDFTFIASNAILSSNHGGVLHAAGVYLEADALINWQLRFKLFFYNLIAPWFFSLSFLPAEASINVYFIEKFRQIQGNGGFVSSYFKFFGIDYFAIVLPAIVFKFFKKYIVFELSGLIVFIISNRFFFYNIASSIRLISLTLTIYFISFIVISKCNKSTI